jgi:hypothetical protein
MDQDNIRSVLDRVGFIRSTCDLDLLLFFVRHPRSLLASEHVAALLGYRLKDIAESLDGLLASGLLRRMQHPSHAARMYLFAAGDPTNGSLPALLQLACTRTGRLSLRKALAAPVLSESSNAVVDIARQRTVNSG